jgi:hypothetical protein
VKWFPRLPKLHNPITEVKTPRLGAFFISLENYQSVDVENGLHEPFGHLQHNYGKKKGRESNWQFDSPPLKVRNRPDSSVCRWSATHHWKALKESYKFASNLIPIGGLNKELWTRKVPGVQTKTISGFLFGSPRAKSHSDVGVVERRREYYMGEGGGFPGVRAVVNFVSLKSFVACPSTKGVPKGEITNLLVGLVQVRVNN